MMVRVVVRLKDRASVRRLVHATPSEPEFLDAEKGVLAFDVPYRRVEAFLNQLANAGSGEFLAHLVQHQ